MSLSPTRCHRLGPPCDSDLGWHVSGWGEVRWDRGVTEWAGGTRAPTHKPGVSGAAAVRTCRAGGHASPFAPPPPPGFVLALALGVAFGAALDLAFGTAFFGAALAFGAATAFFAGIVDGWLATSVKNGGTVNVMRTFWRLRGTRLRPLPVGGFYV